MEKITNLTFKDHYNSLSDEEKKEVRNQFLARSGISYPGFYKKMKYGSFSPLEMDELESICRTNLPSTK